MPLTILLLVVPLVLTDPKPLRSSEFFTMMRETTGGFVLVILFALVGLAGPLVTTILGMVSITHIRHSAGRLYGIGLALFDTLLFPLLAIDGLAIWLVFFLASLPSGEFAYLLIPRHIPPGLILPAMMVCAVVDIVIIRWAWLKANAGLEPEQGDQIAGTP